MSSLGDAITQADQEARNEAVGIEDMFGLGGELIQMLLLTLISFIAVPLDGLNATLTW